MEERMTPAKPERRCLVYVPIAIWTTALALPARAQSLPQGLTCGLSYQTNEFTVNNTCSGQPTYSGQGFGTSSLNAPAPNYVMVWDKDNGLAIPGGFYGFAHQELKPCDPPPAPQNCLSGGLSVAVFGDDSTHFVLPQGAVCGFHHTLYTPGRTCMGYNPTRGFPDIPNDQTSGNVGCPPGWRPRRAFDVNSTIDYWTWCAYDDPHNLSITGNPPPSLATSAVGVACGAVDNNPSNDRNGVCMGYYLAYTPGSQPACPAQATSTGWFDDGDSAGRGLGFCTLTTNTFPSPNSAFGFLDTTTSGDGNFAGWAFDPNAYSDPVNGAPAIFVDVYVDGPDGSGAAGYRIVANVSRPDVNSAYGITGNHGFNFTLPAQYQSDGHNHTIYPYAISLFGQPNILLSNAPGTFLGTPTCGPGLIDCCGDGTFCRSSCNGVICP